MTIQHSRSVACALSVASRLSPMRASRGRPDLCLDVADSIRMDPDTLAPTPRPYPVVQSRQHRQIVLRGRRIPAASRSHSNLASTICAETRSEHPHHLMVIFQHRGVQLRKSLFWLRRTQSICSWFRRNGCTPRGCRGAIFAVRRRSGLFVGSHVTEDNKF